MKPRYRNVMLAWAFGALVATPAVAQEAILQAGERVVRLVANPAQLSLQAGDTVPLTVTALDAQGNELQVAARFAAPRTALTVGAQGRGPGAFTALDRRVIARVAGDYEIVVSVVLPANSTAEPPTLTVPVTVTWPPVARIDVTAAPGTL